MLSIYNNKLVYTQYILINHVMCYDHTRIRGNKTEYYIRKNVTEHIAIRDI